MISATNLTVDFGKQLLFDQVNFSITAKERIALVGKNGAGKSTLLKILAGLGEPTFGSIARPKDMRIGYLPQVMQLDDRYTLFEDVLQVFSNVLKIEEDYERLTAELSERTDYDSPEYEDLIQRHAHLTDLVQIHHKGQYLAEIDRVLLGLGFSEPDFQKNTSHFSGGWRMRIELAKVLLSRPDILLLDEPTNHLDIESIEWLEKFILSSGMALLLVSHDRAFIDATTQRTLEIERGKIYDYKTHYSHYLQLRQERIEQQQRAYENQQKKIQETEDFIERFRYKATKSVQVQSRIKQIEKIERIEVDEQDLSKMSFRFLVAERSGDYPLIVDDFSKSYGDHLVLNSIALTIKRGEKVAFVGKNGSGKTTLVRSIMREISDFRGTLKIGHGVNIAYFAQNQAQELPPEKSVREIIDDAATGPIREKINDLLGAFMFGGERADKKIEVLSGGERSRVILMLLLLKPANLLVLDEPTNHLDIRSKDVLKQAISEFPGTVILVSHDRYFLDGLVDKVYEFSGTKVREHMGGIQEYLLRHRAETLDDLNMRELSGSKMEGAEEEHSASDRYKQQKEIQKRIRSVKKEIEKIEGDMARIESSIKEFEEKMSTETNSLSDADFKRYGEMQKEVESLFALWDEKENELQAIEPREQRNE